MQVSKLQKIKHQKYFLTWYVLGLLFQTQMLMVTDGEKHASLDQIKPLQCHKVR